jgi:hypothetical protein
MQVAQAETLDSAYASWILRSVVHTSCDAQILGTGMNGNKKFWEELIAYFPLIMDLIENNQSHNYSIVGFV